MLKFRYPSAAEKILNALKEHPKKYGLSNEFLQKTTGLHPSVVSEVSNSFYRLGLLTKIPGGGWRLTQWGKLALQISNQLRKNYAMSQRYDLTRSIIADDRGRVILTTNLELNHKIIKILRDSMSEVKKSKRKAREKNDVRTIRMPILGDYSLVNALILSHHLRRIANVEIELVPSKSSEDIIYNILNGKLDIALAIIPIEIFLRDDIRNDIDDVIAIPLEFRGNNKVASGPPGVEIWQGSNHHRTLYYYPSVQRSIAAKIFASKTKAKVEETADVFFIDPRYGYSMARVGNIAFVEFIAMKSGLRSKKFRYLSSLFTILRRDLVDNPSILKAIEKVHQAIIKKKSHIVEQATHRASLLEILRLMKDVSKRIDHLNQMLDNLRQDIVIELPTWTYKSFMVDKVANDVFSSLGLRMCRAF